MSSALINRSPDLSRLRNEGYELEVSGPYLIVRHVPYVRPDAEVDYGELVCELTLAGDQTAKPQTHVVYFTGQTPCNKDGSPIRAIQHGEAVQQMAGLTVQRSFSNKPPEGYADYHHLMTRYVEVLSAPAASLNPAATAQTFHPIGNEDGGSVFAYVDTNTARGHFQATTAKLEGQKIGIVGLGGTGAYVLDLVAKCPVAEIRLFDEDLFLQHNAFRAPGAAPIDDLIEKPFKVDYHARNYSRMHRGIRPCRERLNRSNLSHLDGLDFAFLCMDSGSSKREIVEGLVARKVAFVDAGIGIQNVDDRLLGVVRVTTGTPAKHDHLEKRVSFADTVDDAYSTNIQVAELNMLNAALAVIKWKKLLGFYMDFEREHHTTYSIDGGMLLNDDVLP